MLSYWILRDAEGRAIGLARCENGQISLQLHVPTEADWTLFSDTDAVPLAADGTAMLPDANALLGVRNGRTVAFGGARTAKPAACYRMRLSQICTKQEEPQMEAAMPEQSEEPVEAASEPERTEPCEEAKKPAEPAVSEGESLPDTVDDSAERAAQFSLLLEHASAFYAQFDTPSVANVDNMVQKEDNSENAGGIDLFPQAFARARWRYVDGTDILPHYEGLWIGPNGERVRILAVRGRAAPRPPRALPGFTRYLKGSDGQGYWIRVFHSDGATVKASEP